MALIRAGVNGAGVKGADFLVMEKSKLKILAGGKTYVKLFILIKHVQNKVYIIVLG